MNTQPTLPDGQTPEQELSTLSVEELQERLNRLYTTVEQSIHAISDTIPLAPHHLLTMISLENTFQAHWQDLKATVNAIYSHAVFAQDNEASGAKAARHLLVDFWQRHLTNEDAFCLLVELLGKQKRFYQAEGCYAQLCTALDDEGRLPQKHTQETMDKVRRDRPQETLSIPYSRE